jgi:hypothetical protein
MFFVSCYRFTAAKPGRLIRHALRKIVALALCRTGVGLSGTIWFRSGPASPHSSSRLLFRAQLAAGLPAGGTAEENDVFPRKPPQYFFSGPEEWPAALAQFDQAGCFSAPPRRRDPLPLTGSRKGTNPNREVALPNEARARVENRKARPRPRFPCEISGRLRPWRPGRLPPWLPFPSPAWRPCRGVCAGR